MRHSEKWMNTGKGLKKQNMNSIQLIEKNLPKLETPDDLAIAVAQTLEQHNPNAQWILLKYKPGAHPFTVLFSNSKRMPQAEELVPEAFAPWDAFYMDDLKQSGNAYLLVCSSPMDDEAKEILAAWQSVLKISRQYNRLWVEKTETDFSNQFSQLLHDIESLIELFRNPEADREAILQRIQYQKRLNKRILFYNREPELLPMRLSVGNLLRACLQKQGLDESQLNIDYKDLSPDQTVELDVELFDQAFSEILNNALTATGNDLQKIHIEIRRRTDAFHLILKEWLIVSIIDSGQGINPDFLEWVTQPYFTTWKKSGHTGFGLSIAQKILKAHQGFLEVLSTQGSGTTVNMFLPWFNDDAEE